ncbi:MAG: hypothetical protein J6S58_11235 [Lentisphaeria bacterium]|nr:hypothetical protein [Lentisphaeria bacterium]
MDFQKYVRSLSAAVSLAVTGCSCTFFVPEKQLSTGAYDLEVPERIPMQIKVNVSNFSSIANERFRMSFRQNAVLFRSRDLKRWTQTPGLLLTKYLRLAFRDGEKDHPADPVKKIQLSGEVLSFCTTDKEVELAVSYILRSKNRSVSKTVLLREKLENFSAETFARAMSKAAGRLAHRIAEESTLLAGGKL